MSSCPKPWYSKRHCPVWTRSASSFFRNPLYSFSHAMWVKWWYHAKFQHFHSSLWFSISPSFSSLNKSVTDWKIANDVRMCWKLMTSLWMMHTECKNRLEFKWLKKSKWCQNVLEIDDVALNGVYGTQKSLEL